MNFNKVFLSGRLTRDPELRFTPSGSPVTDVGVAVNRVYNDNSGQKQEETCFVDVVLWRRQAELCQKYLRKGSPIFIEGRLHFDSWQGQDGQRRSRLKVVAERFHFMDGPQQKTMKDEPAAPAESFPPAPEQTIPEEDHMETASDIPF